jgi:CHAT domain-containing protein/pimeloyl-ACP methyl ester carboxylesterase
MIDEEAFIARVEAADPEEFSEILRRPTAEQEKALRVHFGERRFERLHGLALKSSVRRAVTKRGNVVVTHGIMGSELTVFEATGSKQHVWANIPRLIIGAAGWLRLNPDGRPSFDVRPSAIMKKYYGEMILSLGAEWNVRTFCYDWRKDLRDSAADLNRQIRAWFGDDVPVHIIAHSMGGLVSRTYAKAHADRWKKGGRLIMLGTPNHGSFAIPQVITGLNDSVSKLARIDIKHSLHELLEILNSFVGSYQMLPSPLVMPSMAPLYKSSTWSAFNVLQTRLEIARKHHEWLADSVESERMIYVAGCNQLTVVDMIDISRPDSEDAYVKSLAGDGTVPHLLGFLKDKDGKRTPTFFAEVEHGNLPADERIISMMDPLMETGECELPKQIPAARAVVSIENAKRMEKAQQAADDMRLQVLAEKLRARARGIEAGVPQQSVTSEEREAEEIIVRDFLLAEPQRKARAVAMTFVERAPARAEKAGRDEIEIGLVLGEIQSTDKLDIEGYAIDAISVGHYIGVKPQAAELALDIAISSPLPGKVTVARKESAARPPQDADLILTQYTERGIIPGKLGQPFFLEDPRKPGRIVALAGMGIPGRFGAPELTVLVQELCWSLGRMGKRHLATVLIGAGNGNLPIADAIRGWLRGVRRAIAGSLEDEGRRLVRVTFVESDPRNIEAIDSAIKAEQTAMAEQLVVKYASKSLEQLAAVRKDALARERSDLEAEWKRRASGQVRAANQRIPVRLTVGLERKTYTFAAITETAAIPQRNIAIDPTLIEQANSKLAATAEPAEQTQAGSLLERLLMPDDLRASIYTDAPLVLVLDATTARIHWEMVAQSDPRILFSDTTAAPAGEADTPDTNAFLGLSRGLTRQLRTTFASPSEQPPLRRTLRVLVVADPADDAPLPGAQAEGEEVASLFESFNEVYKDLTESRVEVKRLFGPYEATRVNVLSELILKQYDLLHFAGHCVYDVEDPASSGWIFSVAKNERLSANELNRIDRIPKFIFSNACESGITPDRSDLRTAELAPSFAEAFFQRGVVNFVCTAWPVDDQAARDFARRLYSGLLGLIKVGEPEAMHVAMKEARVGIATYRDYSGGGARTWGAYQHYGNPYFRLFDPATMIRKIAAPIAQLVSAAGKRPASEAPPRAKAKRAAKKEEHQKAGAQTPQA